MIIEDLDLETRFKIYGYTKKVLRKYQKGIITGKLTADKFAENIISNGSINDIVDEKLTNEEDFKNSYIEYIDMLIKMQNKNLSNNKRSKYATPVNTKPNIPQKLKLKSLLNNGECNLTIPIDYLNSNDVDSIIKYIETGCIDLGNERIYNYVHLEKKTH